MKRGLLFVGLALAVGATAMVTRQDVRGLLVTGKWINTDSGLAHEKVGSYPVNMAKSPDGRFVAVTNSGYRQQISILDSTTGKLVSKLEFNASTRGKKEALYYGLTFHKAGDQTLLYVSNGYLDTVTVLELAADGKLTKIKEIVEDAPTDSSGLPHHIAGVATAKNGQYLVVANNQSHHYNKFKGSIGVWTMDASNKYEKISVDGFPLAVVGTRDGRAFVSSEMTGGVTEVDLATKKTKFIKTGENPSYLALNKSETMLFVTNANSDTLSVIDTSTGKVFKTVLLRPAEFPGIPGSTPLGLALSSDEKTAYIAMADLNAVAVVDLEESSVKGYIPAGWYPTSVALSPNDKALFIANAKGVGTRNPNGKSVGDLGTYGPNIIEGTVQTVSLNEALGNLAASTINVLENNRATGNYEASSRKAFVKPPIEHVIYIVKENRTYDQVLGDLNRGNRDSSLVLFGRESTPNQHALAERFVLLDNFYVCAEVSADGWNWSTAGMSNEYVARNTLTNYSRRGRNYDFEGQINGSPVDVQGMHNPAEPAGGYVWDQAAAQNVSQRNYGFFVNNQVADKDNASKPIAEEGVPNQKAHQNVTNRDFRKYDMEFADSEAWVKHGLPKAPRQLEAYGSQKDPSRMTTWLRDFNGFVKSGKMPKLQVVRLGRDHTSGTTPGQPSPRACVADNDYAVGQLVEAVSNSPYWKSTAIFVLEDDAQAGTDHVESHRSIAFVISPYIQRAKLDSSFYNTNSMLRTMGLLLGLKPWNQYIATAYPMGVFEKTMVNPAPYKAILPSKEIVGEVNTRTAYRAADSERLINPLEEESMPDVELNDILWGAIKGAKTPRPKTPNTIWRAQDLK